MKEKRAENLHHGGYSIILKQYGKAYHYLMKVNGGIQVDTDALKAESERLTAHRAKLQKNDEPKQ